MEQCSKEMCPRLFNDVGTPVVCTNVLVLFLVGFFFFFNPRTLSQGYLEKKLRIRKKSTIPDIGEGAFIELQKLYDLNQPNAAFHGDPKQRAREAINCLDALLQELEQNGDNSSSTGSSSSSSESVRVSVVSEAKEIKAEEADASAWSQVDDPDSGAKYWYNSVTGASQWEQP
jgi:hypothetical protein